MAPGKTKLNLFLIYELPPRFLSSRRRRRQRRNSYDVLITIRSSFSNYVIIGTLLFLHHLPVSLL